MAQKHAAPAAPIAKGITASWYQGAGSVYLQHRKDVEHLGAATWWGPATTNQSKTGASPSCLPLLCGNDWRLGGHEA